MSCNLEPVAMRFNQRLARLYGMSPARLEHRETDVHDIASIPAQHSIQFGKLYRTSSPQLKRQKILHEWQHFRGLVHDGKARAAGYFSDPKRDRYSRELLKKAEGRQRNPRHENPWFAFHPDRYGGISGLVSYWIRPNGDEDFYAEYPEGPPLHVQQVKRYLQEHDGFTAVAQQEARNANWKPFFARMAVPERLVRVQGNSVEVFTSLTEKQLDAIQSLAYKHNNRLAWDIHTPKGVTSGDGSFENFMQQVKRVSMGGRKLELGSVAYWHTQANPQNLKQNPWIDVPFSEVMERTLDRPGGWASYWIKPDGDYAYFSQKASSTARDTWPIHGEQLTGWLGSDHDAWWPEIRKAGIIRVQGGASFGFWKKPNDTQLTVVREHFEMNGDAGAWDFFDGPAVAGGGTGSYRDFQKALGQQYGGAMPKPTPGRFDDAFAFMRNPKDRLYGIVNLHTGSVLKSSPRLDRLQEKMSNLDRSTYLLAELNKRGDAVHYIGVSRRNPHQLFPPVVKYTLMVIKDGYAAMQPSNNLEGDGLAWLSQRRLAWVDRDGFYHLNERGQDAWMHAKANESIEMGPALTYKGLYDAAKPAVRRAPRVKPEPKPPVEFESDLPETGMAASMIKLARTMRTRKRGSA